MPGRHPHRPRRPQRLAPRLCRAALHAISVGQTDFVRNDADPGVIIPARAILASRYWWGGLSDAEREAIDAAVDTANAATAPTETALD